MKKNVGKIDALIRITVGLSGLAYAAGKMSRRPYRTPGLLMFLSAMKVAEGITRYCPVLSLFGISTRQEDMISMLMDKTLRKSMKSASGSTDATTTLYGATDSTHTSSAHDAGGAPSVNSKEATDAIVKSMTEEIAKAVADPS
ncbi:MAG: DUF2892 domain-containing protein [Clostridia bacterium]